MNNYDDDTVSNVRILYIVLIIIWLLLILYLKLYITDFMGMLILSIPIIYFLINMFYFDKCTPSIENEIFQYDILAFGVVIITVFLGFKFLEYSNFFYKLIFVGVLLLGISMLDLWLPRMELIVVKHFKGGLQIISTVIFIYLFYTFYFISSNTEDSCRNPFIDYM